MKAKSLLPRNFFRQPEVRKMRSDLKLLAGVLRVGCESHVGCWIPGGLGEDTGLTPEVLQGALADLERPRHVLSDRETGEVFLVSFFRENVFPTEVRRRQAQSDFSQIRSQKLRDAVISAIKNSPECGLRPDMFPVGSELPINQCSMRQEEGEEEVKEKGKTAEHSAKYLVDKCKQLGVEVNNQEDEENLTQLVVDLGGRLDLIRNAIAIVRARPSRRRLYLSSVGVEARSLLANERYQDRLAKASLAVTRVAKAGGYGKLDGPMDGSDAAPLGEVPSTGDDVD